MFFPKGSQWDALVVLGNLMATVKHTVTIVDSYSDRTIFDILTPPPVPNLRIEILCSKYAPAVAAAAKPFMAQFFGVTTEVRSALKEFHDRFVVLDGYDCIHVGASLKDAGKTAFMISRVEDDANRVALLSSIKTAWHAGVVVT